jgi:archaeal flagellin N-terminal-like domain
MKQFLATLIKDERGLSALETAIVLIAFVVVASVFAFTMLSAGTFSTQRSKEAVYAGLSEVRGSLELKGSVLADTDGSKVTHVIFTIANVAGGEPIDLTEPTDSDNNGLADANSNNKVIISYRDKDHRFSDLAWTATYLGKNDNDNLLETGELAQIDVDMTAVTTPTLGANTTFALEVKPPQGGVLVLERTTPPALDTVVDLH